MVRRKKKRAPSKATFVEASKARAVKATRRKKGKKAAQRQLVAIAFSKAGLTRKKKKRRK